MRIRRPWLIVVVLLLMPTAARAHDHTADFFGALSYAEASKLWGLHESLGITLPTLLDKDLSVVGDLTLHVGKHDRGDLTRVTFMVGIRYTPSGMRLFKNLVSVHALFGGVHDGGPDSGTEPAFALGAGWEYLPKKDARGWGFRVQGDYVFSRGEEDFPRFSAGVVYRIKN